MASVQKSITATCVTYLSFDTFETGFCSTDDEFEERLRLNFLYDYAAHNWGHHGRRALKLCQEVTDFLNCEAKVEASSQALMAVKRYSRHSEYSQEVPRRMTRLHLAAYFGIKEVANALLSSGLSPDLTDSYGRTSLSWAAEKGHEAVVKLLIDTGKVDVDSKDFKYGQTPLSRAAEKGHEAVVKLLIDTGKVDVNSKDSYDGQTPLSRAA
ncbi:ankyrin repeat-containing domain protein, partial [Phaeosphaeriaceae sp. PMI808]